MIQPDPLATLMDQTAQVVFQKGDLTWQRTQDWTRTPKVPLDSTRGGGLADGEPDDTLRERIDDTLASRYRSELDKLTHRLDTDLRRLQVIIDICTPTRPRSVASREILAAQAAADGWCISCFRNAGHLAPIALRPGTQTPYYVDRCRSCGEWRKETGEDPPIDVLRTRHRGGRVKVKA